MMTADPWNDPDPRPGDFDADLAGIDPRHVDVHPGHEGATLRILVNVEGKDAELLARLAGARGKKPSDVIAELLREADRPAA